jgi:hypothetical protein
MLPMWVIGNAWPHHTVGTYPSFAASPTRPEKLAKYDDSHYRNILTCIAALWELRAVEQWLNGSKMVRFPRRA